MPPKTCRKCGLTYANPAASFGRNKRQSSGLRTECKRCQADMQRKYLKDPAVKARRKAQLRAWYGRNVSRERQRKRVYGAIRYHQRKADKARWLVTLYRLRRVKS